ncbi:hypothetical protein E2493_03780 [Sphingomonas parva]|uniref:Flagellar biosynthesis protein FliO n=1 Tax=Sphingomonas parva TaxID=2555898 RepID=A0A4Y8ZUA0_9SPHN|nr:flagellar biosynthetic protein FliO [Sphingomonas parva]TFI59603.1 hypothetical protein E2493_03780 [Sphingomonas parva]
MDLLSFLRTIAALGTVLGLLVGALWAVRRYNIVLPGQAGPRTARRLALVEKVGIDGKRAVVLIRRDDREHLIMIAPEGQTVIETGIVYQAQEGEGEAVTADAPAAKVQQDFATLVDLVGTAGRKAREALAKRREAASPVDEALGVTRAPKPQPSFATLVEKVGAKAQTRLAKAARPAAAEAVAPPPPAKPKRPAVRLKVTAPDGRTVVEPISAAVRTPAAQAA